MAAISMHSPRMPTERRVYTCTQPPTGERMQNPLGSNGLVATPAATSVSPRSLRPRNGRGPSLAGGRRSVTRAASHVQRHTCSGGSSPPESSRRVGAGLSGAPIDASPGGGGSTTSDGDSMSVGDWSRPPSITAFGGCGSSLTAVEAAAPMDTVSAPLSAAPSLPLLAPSPSPSPPSRCALPPPHCTPPETLSSLNSMTPAPLSASQTGQSDAPIRPACEADAATAASASALMELHALELPALSLSPPSSPLLPRLRQECSTRELKEAP